MSRKYASNSVVEYNQCLWFQCYHIENDLILPIYSCAYKIEAIHKITMIEQNCGGGNCFPFIKKTVFFSQSLSYQTENASRFCHPNGTWDKSNYDQCDQLDLTFGIETLPHLEYITHIWTAGYTLSLVSLILGIAIFIHFK